MTDCAAKRIEFCKPGRRRLEAEFNGGEVSSDGGLVLLREVDRRPKLTAPGIGAACLIRTDDRSITNRVLYQLS